jgi:creatine kinase
VRTHARRLALFAARHKPAPLPLATQVDKVKKKQPDNLCAKYLDKKYYSTLEGADRDTFYKCVRTGIDNPDSGMGCYAMTPGGEGRAFEPAAT